VCLSHRSDAIPSCGACYAFGANFGGRTVCLCHTAVPRMDTYSRPAVNNSRAGSVARSERAGRAEKRTSTSRVAKPA